MEPEIKKEDSKTSISFYTLDNRVEDIVRSEIDRVFNCRAQTSQTENMKGMVYTCVKELMVNASRSNIKKTFFIEAKINESDREIYNQAKKNVKKLMNEHCLPYMREKLKKHHQQVEVDIEHDLKGVVLTVKSSAALLKEEEKNIRQTFRTGMQDDFPDISLFYTEDENHNENAGIGLLLVIQLMKEMGINPALFRMGVVNNDTIARIEIPLCEGYVGLRS